MIIQDESPQGPANFSPGIGSSYKNGLDKVSKNLLVFILIFLVTLAFNIPTIISSFAAYNLTTIMFVNVLLYGYGILVIYPVEFGVSYAYLRAARGEKPEVNDIGIVLKNYWNVVFASILYVLIVMVGFFLFLVPGIIFACKLAFIRYLVTDEKMSTLEAIDTSWKMTNGYSLDIFLMGLLAIPIFIAGALLFGIGVIFAAMWVEGAFASLYHAVSIETKFGKAYSNSEDQPPQGPIMD